MSRLREPVGPADAVVALTTAAAVFAVQHWVVHLTTAMILVAIVVLELVVQPVSTLLHELGHAVAAGALGANTMSVMVGRGPWARFKLGRVQVNFSLLPARGVLIRGVCRYQADGLAWRRRAWIALAGPAATLLELLLVVTLGRAGWSTAWPLVRALILLTGSGLLASALVNLIPAHRKGAVLPTDGWVARRSLQLHRQGAPPPRPKRADPSCAGAPQLGPDGRLPAQSAPADPGQREAFDAEEAGHRLGQIQRQRDQERAKTSVPPPRRASP